MIFTYVTFCYHFHKCDFLIIILQMWFSGYHFTDVISDYHFTDADECVLRTANCPSNSQCVNQDPGFQCNCLTGYIKEGALCQGTCCEILVEVGIWKICQQLVISFDQKWQSVITKPWL